MSAFLKRFDNKWNCDEKRKRGNIQEFFLSISSALADVQ